MNQRIISREIDQWLQSDIEVAQSSASDLQPSLQRQVMLGALNRIDSPETTYSDGLKLLGVVQAILAGIYSLLGENEAIELFEKLVASAFSKRHEGEHRARTLTVAALILSRIRKSAEYISEETVDALKDRCGQKCTAEEEELIYSMCKRLETSFQRAKDLRHRSKRHFRLPELNIPKAAKNVRDDITGDWYQDPWAWPEVEWLGSSRRRVEERLQADQFNWTVAIDVPKSNRGVRPGLVMNPLDRIAFQTLVDDLSIEAASHLPNWAFGWRLSRNRAAKGDYESNQNEWKLFSETLTTRRKQFKYTAHLDIESFFATVDTSKLLAQLGRRYRHAGVLDRLEAYLRSWSELPNGAGIPQRFQASAVLAHAVLKPLDTYLDKRSLSSRSKTFLASRWMDDIWLHSDSEETLRAAVLEIENIIGELGLSLNSEKTAIVESEKSNKIVRLVDVYEEREEEPDLALLKLLEGAEQMNEPPAFQIGFEVARLINQKRFHHLSQLSSLDLSRFNYAADRVAKALRLSGDWRRFVYAYVDVAKTHVSQDDLSIARWGEMFPSQPQNDIRVVHSFFAERLLHGLQRVTIPLAAQRLVAWSGHFGLGSIDPSDLCPLLDCDDLFRVRGVCFAMLKSRHLRDTAKMAIESFDDLTLEFLRERDFQPPELSDRFRTQ